MIRALPPVAALLLALLCLAWPNEANANVSCQITNMSINFGSSTSGTGSVNYSCTSYGGSSGTFTIVCPVVASP